MKKLFLYLICAVLVTSVFLYYNEVSDGTNINSTKKSRNDSDSIYVFSPPVVQQETNIGNLPEYFLENSKAKPSSYNKSCAKFPDVFDVKFSNDHWQTQKTSNGTFQLFNAYLDDRPFNKEPVIRIVGLFDIVDSEKEYFCQIWYKTGEQPVFSKTHKIYRIWVKGWGGDNNGIYQPSIITCPIPQRDNPKTPLSVSLVENQCDFPTNNLKIIYNKIEREKQKNFIVCVKGLNFPFSEMSYRLTEWIELLFLLGADKVNLYNFNVHPNLEKLFEYYRKNRAGNFEVTPISLVGDISNRPYLQNKFLIEKALTRRLQEVIPYNDCLYKHLYEYKYVVLLDTDEIIVPLEDTWNELLGLLESKFKNKASFLTRNVYFLDDANHAHDWFEDIPSFMHMLQHVHRSANYTKAGYYVKGFHNTSKVVALHNHFPLLCDGYCECTEIDLELAHLQHYRADCVKGVKACQDMKENSVMDTRVWRFKEELVERVVRVLGELGFLKKPTE